MGDGVKVEGGIGFKGIRQKSLHFKSSRFRENLMEISMLTQENSLTDFVQNLGDMQILFTSMSPATVEFFQNSFNTTRFTRVVRNLDWRLGDTLKVIGTPSSAMTAGLAGKLLYGDKQKGTESEDVQNRQVITKMLSLEWVTASYKGYENVGFRELIVELANAPHESLFSTELIITLVEHFWDYYYKRIFLYGFIPYIIYFLCTIFYVTIWSVEGIDYDKRWDLTPEFVVRWIILILVIYFVFFEVVAIVRDGWNYLTDVFNYFDWAAFILNFYVTYTTVFDPEISPGKESDEEFKQRRAVAAFLAMLMWVKTFYWMRLFTYTSFYIRLIQETFSDIKYFLILFVFILMTFGNALMIMN